VLIIVLFVGDFDYSFEVMVLEVLFELCGVFSLVFMDEYILYVVRDWYGICLFVFGWFEWGWVVVSEMLVLVMIGVSFICEIEFGELVVIDVNGLCSSCFVFLDFKGCVFEYVYFVCFDIIIVGCVVYEVWVEMGCCFVVEYLVEVDLVIGVLEFGMFVVIGYVEVSGILFG